MRKSSVADYVSQKNVEVTDATLALTRQKLDVGISDNVAVTSLRTH